MPAMNSKDDTIYLIAFYIGLAVLIITRASFITNVYVCWLILLLAVFTATCHEEYDPETGQYKTNWGVFSAIRYHKNWAERLKRGNYVEQYLNDEIHILEINRFIKYWNRHPVVPLWEYLGFTENELMRLYEFQDFETLRDILKTRRFLATLDNDECTSP